MQGANNKWNGPIQTIISHILLSIRISVKISAQLMHNMHLYMQHCVAMISTKFIRFSFDKLARTHKIARSFSPRVLVSKPVLTGSAYVTHAPQEPHFGSDTLPLFDTRKWSKYNHTAPCLYNSNSFKEF